MKKGKVGALSRALKRKTSPLERLTLYNEILRDVGATEVMTIRDVRKTRVSEEYKDFVQDFAEEIKSQFSDHSAEELKEALMETQRLMD